MNFRDTRGQFAEFSFSPLLNSSITRGRVRKRKKSYAKLPGHNIVPQSCSPNVDIGYTLIGHHYGSLCSGSSLACNFFRFLTRPPGGLGKEGRGTVSHFGLDGKVEIQIGTLSKAFASVGGYAATTQSLRDYMGSVARPFLFSSSQPPSVAATSLAVLDILLTEPWHLKNLWDNTAFLKEELKKAGFDTGASVTPITPIMTAKAVEFSKPPV